MKTNFYVRLSAWQLFTLLFIPLFIDGVIPFNDYEGVHLLLKSTFILIYFHWTYNLAQILITLSNMVVKFSVKLFNVNYFFCLLYVIMMGVIANTQSDFIREIYYIFIPFHLYASYCIFYLIWILSKALTSIEIKKEATFNEFAGTFFLFWFIPIGIWWLQPRIRKL